LAGHDRQGHGGAQPCSIELPNKSTRVPEEVRRTSLPCTNEHVPFAVFSGKDWGEDSVVAVAVDEVIGERGAGKHVGFDHRCGWVDVLGGALLDGGVHGLALF